jgi:archaellum biogenesis ATPase FlaH
MPDSTLPPIEPFQRVATGVEGLDEILGGGLPQEYVYLREGSTGTGKTTIGLQFLLEGARRGERRGKRADVLAQLVAEHLDRLRGIGIAAPPVQ